MGRKAQGLSLNTIIIAIIVLIVLVVIIMVFTGYFGTRFTPGVTSCENSGGTCQFAKADGSNGCGYDSLSNSIAKLSGKCVNAEQICCSKGLGSGTAPEDFSNCGEAGEKPCPPGGVENCKGTNPRLEGVNCVPECTGAVGCIAQVTGTLECEETAPGYCIPATKICCQTLV